MYECMKLNTVLPAYYQFPEFLLKLPLSQTAKIVYVLLYDRARLSQKNEWIDFEGNVFAIFPIKELAKKSGKGETTIKVALNELERLGLLKRRSGGFSKPNHLYVCVPTEQQILELVGKATDADVENGLSNGQETDCEKVGFSPPSKVIETNKYSKGNKVSNSSKVKMRNNARWKKTKELRDYTFEEGESL